MSAFLRCDGDAEFVRSNVVTPTRQGLALRLTTPISWDVKFKFPARILSDYVHGGEIGANASSGLELSIN